MPVFNTDAEAWSKLTAQFETRFGGSIAPLVPQINTVLTPLSCRTKYVPLNLYREQLAADAIPAYLPANKPLAQTGSRVSDNFEQYLAQLMLALRKKAPAVDQQATDRAERAYNAALKKLGDFEDLARKEWASTLRHHPDKPRAIWERDWQYRDKRIPVAAKVDTAYADYLAQVASYPALRTVMVALRNYQNPLAFAHLPMTEEQAEFGVANPEGSQTWDEFRQSFLNFDIKDFLSHDAPDSLIIRERSEHSTSYENRWSGSASVGYGFFSVSASAEGGTIEKHMQASASSFSISFKKLGPANVLRRNWYNESLIRTYCREVNREEYWGLGGTLNMIPQTVIIGRGISISIEVDQATYDEFQTWYTAHGSAGFSFGPWSVGGGGSSSTSFTDVRNASAGTTIKIEDTSDQLYVVGIISLRPSDLYDHPGLAFKDEVAEIDNQIVATYAQSANIYARLTSESTLSVT